MPSCHSLMSTINSFRTAMLCPFNSMHQSASAVPHFFITISTLTCHISLSGGHTVSVTSPRPFISSSTSHSMLSKSSCFRPQGFSPLEQLPCPLVCCLGCGVHLRMCQHQGFEADSECLRGTQIGIPHRTRWTTKRQDAKQE